MSGGWPAFMIIKIGERPLLLLGMLLIILGVQFVAMGLSAELIVRTYYESQGKHVYMSGECSQRNTGPAAEVPARLVAPRDAAFSANYPT